MDNSLFRGRLIKGGVTISSIIHPFLTEYFRSQPSGRIYMGSTVGGGEEVIEAVTEVVSGEAPSVTIRTEVVAGKIGRAHV